MDLSFLLGLFITSFVVPFLSATATMLAKRMFGEQTKTLPDTPDNAIVVVFFVKY